MPRSVIDKKMMSKKRIVHSKGESYRIGMNEDDCFTIERQTGHDENANALWSKEFLLPSWCEDVLKMIARYADKHLKNQLQ